MNNVWPSWPSCFEKELKLNEKIRNYSHLRDVRKVRSSFNYFANYFRYVTEVQKDGRIYQLNNPEVTVDVQEDNGIISLQINNLKLITTKLHNAYHGVDVEWNVPNLGKYF